MAGRHKREGGRQKVLRAPHGQPPTDHQTGTSVGPQGHSGKFFQLLSGHAKLAPLLRDRWGWTDTDVCWWCNEGRQSREHLFKECTAWTKEIQEHWAAVGAASGGRSGIGGSQHMGRKGFGYRVREARARPSNTSIRNLLSDDRYTEAVWSFLGATIGKVWEGVICS